MVQFAALHFCELQPEDSEHPLLTRDILDLILSDRSLRIDSEDWLCNFLVSRCDSDPTCFPLLEFVQFECLTAVQFNVFVDWSLHHFDCITPAF
jgi:hypothetical protein